MEELFHVEQDLLEKIYKKFFKSETSRQDGTLAHFKSILRRTNVNGKVKSTGGFEAHSDFLTLVTRCLIVELTCEVCNLPNDDAEWTGTPTHFKVWSREKKRQWLYDFVQPVAQKVLVHFRPPSTEKIKMTVQIGVHAYNLEVPPEYRGKHLDMMVDGALVKIPMPGDGEPPKGTGDQLYDYNMSLLRVSLDLYLFHEVIRGGDINRLTILLKRLAPTFVALTSYRSKYAIECVNFLTKTQFMLSDRDSVRVRLAAFVNTSGQHGHNKAADMQQENNIKKVKGVIRGLGAGKTDKAIERISKAAPLVSNMVDTFADMVGVKGQAPNRTSKSSEADAAVLTGHLHTVRPFNVTVGRMLIPFSDSCDSVLRDMDKFKFSTFVKRHSQRTLTRFGNADDSDTE